MSLVAGSAHAKGRYVRALECPNISSSIVCANNRSVPKSPAESLFSSGSSSSCYLCLASALTPSIEFKLVGVGVCGKCSGPLVVRSVRAEKRAREGRLPIGLLVIVAILVFVVLFSSTPKDSIEFGCH